MSLCRRAVLAAPLLSLGREASSQAPRDVAIGLASTSFATAPARLANLLGLYAQYGLKPRFIVLENASAATTALVANAVDAALSGPGELVVAQARGLKVVVAANIYAGLSGSLVLAKPVAERLGVLPTAPVADRLKALDGVLIAGPSATGAYTVALRSAAKAAGATMRFTYMSLASMPAALDSGAIQGFIAGAPFWAAPIRNENGVVWISGPKAELPASSMPASSANLQVIADRGVPAVGRALSAVFADFAAVLAQRPAEVKAATAKLYPDLDPATVDILFDSEASAWITKKPTPADIARDIDFVKSIGTPIQGIETLNPAAMILS